MGAQLISAWSRWRCLFVLPVLACVSCSGGSSTLHPVKGSVIYKNEPLKGAVVTFHPKGDDDVRTVRPVGLTGDDGSFSLSTGDQPGAKAGTYVVTIICSEVVKPKGKAEMSTAAPDTRDRLEGAYANRAASKIEVEIKSGPNQLEPFRLK
jgi:hypothetical protein